jgi:hypothetical protein
MTHACSIDPGSPMPEEIDYCVCAGQVLEPARCAIRAAELGAGEDAWRRLITSQAVPARAVVASEECVHASGLWPWVSVYGSQAGHSACTCSVGA